MTWLAIDPGTYESGWVVYDGTVIASGVCPNAEIFNTLREYSGVDRLAIEMVASYGMPVGKEVFDTVRWIGRFQQAWRDPDGVVLVYRKDVKLFLCGVTTAKDSNVRRAVMDAVGEPGTKSKPGPTYGVKSHAWQALAVAYTASGGAR